MKLLERRVSQIIVCDYCRHRKCSWSRYDSSNTPSSCFKIVPTEIADKFIGKTKFKRRVKLAKRLASFDPDQKVWYLDPTVKNPLTGYELRDVVDKEVNEWSEHNDLQLSDLIDYKEEGFERLG
ncbi:MAG: hypothetical protein R6U61_08205 [Thermoplasmata archaeon]